MDSIEPRRGKNWLALHANDQVRELMLQMSAQGISDAKIAVYMTDSGLVTKITPEDVAYYRVANATAICDYSRKHVNEIIRKATRAQKGFRIGELDDRIGMFAAQITPELIASKPNLAAQLMKAYLAGLDQLKKETGELEGSSEQKNSFIESYDRGTPEEKEELMRSLATAERIKRQIRQRALNEGIIEGEFEAEDR